MLSFLRILVRFWHGNWDIVYVIWWWQYTELVTWRKRVLLHFGWLVSKSVLSSDKAFFCLKKIDALVIKHWYFNIRVYSCLFVSFLRSCLFSVSFWMVFVSIRVHFCLFLMCSRSCLFRVLSSQWMQWFGGRKWTRCRYSKCQVPQAQQQMCAFVY